MPLRHTHRAAVRSLIAAAITLGPALCAGQTAAPSVQYRSPAGVEYRALPDTDAVKSALVLDEVARREDLEVSDEEAEREVGRFAERTGRAPAEVRARLEKEGGLSRVYSGLRREKSIDFLMARATISGDS